MEAIRETQKRYCTRAMAAAIVTALVLMVAGQKGLGKGLVLGTFFSILNFILLGETLPMRIVQSRGTAFFLSLVSVCLRYGLLAVPLLAALKWSQVNIVAVIFGIFMVQLVIFTDHIHQWIKS